MHTINNKAVILLCMVRSSVEDLKRFVTKFINDDRVYKKSTRGNASMPFHYIDITSRNRFLIAAA